jgi:CBS domain-containing protein
MAQTFDLSHAPFDRLSPAEAEVARAAAEIGYFGLGETFLPDSLFMVLKGCFEERKDRSVSLRSVREILNGK